MSCCEEYLELISASLDGELSPQEQSRLEAHLAQCPQCRALLEQLSDAHETLSSLPPVAPPADLTQNILDALDASAPTAARRPRRSAALLAWAASIALLIGAGAWLGAAQPWRGAPLLATGGATSSTAESVAEAETEDADESGWDASACDAAADNVMTGGAILDNGSPEAPVYGGLRSESNTSAPRKYDVPESAESGAAGESAPEEPLLSMVSGAASAEAPTLQAADAPAPGSVYQLQADVQPLPPSPSPSPLP